MERIKINLPETFSFTTSIQIRITDLNYGGHVGNDSFLSIIHEARIQFLNYYGYSELNVEGVGLIMADVAIEYKKELNYGDIVSVSVIANGFDKLGFDIFYLLELNKEEGKMIAGKAKTGMMCYDYNLKKRVPVPLNFIHKFQ
ncbi:MAG: thioesterase family protein [Bacteroidetes bacterium]|nr:thioesterase family protein [Bacteroidota bacterium]MBS1648735.1 thioesterase family protein [Bacteroidota bacterium]